MKILFVSNLFPDQDQPIWGLDNALVTQELNQSHEVRVLATRFRWALPFAPKKRPGIRPTDQGLCPEFLDIPYWPKIGNRINHRLYARHLGKKLEAIRATFPFERILCAWLYPDGWAVARNAVELDVPYALIAQGSDVHQYLDDPHRKRSIVWAANHSLGVITRSADLGERLKKAGVHTHIPKTIYNGVDHNRFTPGNRAAVRKALGLPPEAEIILFVGNLLPIKRPDWILTAFAQWAKASKTTERRLILLGDGPLRESLESQIQSHDLQTRVTLAGRQAPEVIAQYMQAADLLTLASINEGVPNVILESLACGLPVVAPSVGGIAEVLSASYLGQTIPLPQPDALIPAWDRQLATQSDPSSIHTYAQKFTWSKTAAAYAQLLEATQPTSDASSPR